MWGTIEGDYETTRGWVGQSYTFPRISVRESNTWVLQQAQREGVHLEYNDAGEDTGKREENGYERGVSSLPLYASGQLPEISTQNVRLRARKYAEGEREMATFGSSPVGLGAEHGIGLSAPGLSVCEARRIGLMKTTRFDKRMNDVSIDFGIAAFLIKGMINAKLMSHYVRSQVDFFSEKGEPRKALNSSSLGMNAFPYIRKHLAGSDHDTSVQAVCVGVPVHTPG